MIQRIQSIFLAFVAVTMIVMNFFPLWEKLDLDKNERVSITTYEMVHERLLEASNVMETISSTATIYIAVLSILSAILAVYSLFQYKNRLTQIKLGALNSLLIGGSLGVAVYFIFEGEKVFQPLVQGNYLPGFYFTAAALFFNALANRFIRRDEQLVRSADRIR